MVCRTGPQGNAALGLLQDPLNYLEAVTRQAKIVGLKLGPEAVVLISDQAAAKQILIDQSSSFGKVGLFPQIYMLISRP